MIATQPTFFLGIFPVSLAHEGQGDPSPLLLFPPPTVMTVGPAAGAGGGGAYIGAAMGAAYIDDKL